MLPELGQFTSIPVTWIQEVEILNTKETKSYCIMIWLKLLLFDFSFNWNTVQINPKNLANIAGHIAAYESEYQ